MVLEEQSKDTQGDFPHIQCGAQSGEKPLIVPRPLILTHKPYLRPFGEKLSEVVTPLSPLGSNLGGHSRSWGSEATLIAMPPER